MSRPQLATYINGFMVFKILWFQMPYFFYLLFSFFGLYHFHFTNTPMVFVLQIQNNFAKTQTLLSYSVSYDYFQIIWNILFFFLFFCFFFEEGGGGGGFGWNNVGTKQSNVWYIKNTVPCTRDQHRCTIYLIHITYITFWCLLFLQNSQLNLR